VKNEELTAQVSALQIQPGTIVVVQFKRDVTTDEADRLGKSLRAIVPEENRIILAANDVEISALDEAQMRKIGWVKQSIVDELLAAYNNLRIHQLSKPFGSSPDTALEDAYKRMDAARETAKGGAA
jgi:hypothetical protein